MTSFGGGKCRRGPGQFFLLVISLGFSWATIANATDEQKLAAALELAEKQGWEFHKARESDEGKIYLFSNEFGQSIHVNDPRLWLHWDQNNPETQIRLTEISPKSPSQHYVPWTLANEIDLAREMSERLKFAFARTTNLGFAQVQIPKTVYFIEPFGNKEVNGMQINFFGLGTARTNNPLSPEIEHPDLLKRADPPSWYI